MAGGNTGVDPEMVLKCDDDDDNDYDDNDYDQAQENKTKTRRRTTTTTTANLVDKSSPAFPCAQGDRAAEEGCLTAPWKAANGRQPEQEAVSHRLLAPTPVSLQDGGATGGEGLSAYSRVYYLAAPHPTLMNTKSTSDSSSDPFRNSNPRGGRLHPYHTYLLNTAHPSCILSPRDLLAPKKLQAHHRFGKEERRLPSAHCVPYSLAATVGPCLHGSAPYIIASVHLPLLLRT
ncbi:hypothetical protein J1614_008943 [Plenodomus biglobosus]|nr:hypothetical protein J1614_008943 [Plenodomus biglobosus]